MQWNTKNHHIVVWGSAQGMLRKNMLHHKLSPRDEVLCWHPIISQWQSTQSYPSQQHNETINCTFHLHPNGKVICFLQTCNYICIEWQLTLPFPLHFRKLRLMASHICLIVCVSIISLVREEMRMLSLRALLYTVGGNFPPPGCGALAQPGRRSCLWQCRITAWVYSHIFTVFTV